MFGLALGNEHRSYKGPYADVDHQVRHELPAKKKSRAMALILSALGIVR
jgi:hypothetical protein